MDARQRARQLRASPAVGLAGRAVAILLLLETPAFLAQQQAPVPATGQSIRGRVIDEATGATLARAGVVAYSGGVRSKRILTDDRGRFEVPAAALPASLRIAKAGYATTVVPVARDSDRGDIDILVPRGGAISGRVADAIGRPLVDAWVRAQRVAPAGTREAVSIRFAAATDDRGEFRIGGLPAGRYAVNAILLPSLPGVDVLEAFDDRAIQGKPDPVGPAGPVVTIDLARGEEISSIDLSLAVSSFECLMRTMPPRPATTGTGSIRGSVRGESGQPLPCIRVSLRQPGVPITPYLTSTDPQGRYSFSGVSRGSYLVEAGSTGFVTRQYGQRPDARTGNAVDLEDGEVVERIDILLPRAPAITGTVVDEHGEPVEGASVSALRILPVDGRLTAAPSSPRPRRTDDRGEYRVFGLAPGSYLVTASIDALVAAPDGGPPRGYVPMFFPGTPDPTHAGHVTVVPGADRDGVAVVLSRTPGARIAGTALDRMGRPFKGTVALSVSERSGVIRLQPRTTEPGPGGTFAFDNVPPGDYVVQAFELSGNARQFGMQYMTVADGDPAPIVVRTSPGPTIEFRVRLEGESDDQPVPPAALPFPVGLDYSPLVGIGPSTSGMFPETIGVGRFKVTAATGPRRFVLESALEIADWYAVRQRDPGLNLRRDVFAAVSESWYIKSARVDGADALDAPFDFGLADTVYRDVEIVVSPAGAAIEGRATDALDKPVADYAVVVFSVYSDYWFRNSRHLKFAPSAPDGRFLITGLPPGDYYVAAVDTLEGTAEGGEWQDRAILTQLVTRAQQVTLSERERKTVALDIIRR